MSKARRVEVTLWALRLVERMNARQRLHCEAGPSGPRYWLEPCGREVGGATVRECVEKGLIVAHGGNLMPDDPPQTYVLSPLAYGMSAKDHTGRKPKAEVRHEPVAG